MKCEYCSVDVEDAKIQNHMDTHIVDVRDVHVGMTIDGLLHKEVYFDINDWDAKGYVKKLEEMSTQIDAIFKKASDDKIPSEVIFYLVHNYKIAYAKMVALSQPQVKIAVSKE